MKNYAILYKHLSVQGFCYGGGAGGWGGYPGTNALRTPSDDCS